MNKRGQVTIFIIIAIVLVVAVASYFIFRDNLTRDTSNLEEAPIINFVQECFDQSLEDAVDQIAKNGGYSDLTSTPRESTNSGQTYYLIEGENYLLPKEEIKEELDRDIARNYFLCSQHFIDFPEYEITEGNLEISIEILDDSVIIESRYPLTITKGEESSRVEKFESEIDVRLGLVYDSIYDFINQQIKYKEEVCLSCLNLASENDIYVGMENEYNGTVIFTFRDDYSKLNNEPLEWVFANKYE